MTRTAHCACGALKVEASGEPAFVAACHCIECQRRTGSVFGVSAYFRERHITASGPAKTFVRDGQEGRKLHMHFCPDCGTTVYWQADFRPGFIGVAVGAFADPRFPLPAFSVWEQSRHPWLAFEHGPACFDRAPG